MSSQLSTDPPSLAPSNAKLTRDDYDRFASLVRSLALRLSSGLPRGAQIAQLERAGWVGLLEAAKRSEALTPVEFEEYSCHRIHLAMIEHVRRLDPRLDALRSESRRLARALRQLEVAAARPPTEEEVAGALDLSVAKYRELLSTLGDAGFDRLELIDLDASTPPAIPVIDSLAAEVATGIDRIPQIHRTVLGLRHQDRCTPAEIGLILGISETRVTQLLTESMHRLRATIGRE